MIRSLLRLVILAVLAIVAYNFFFGTTTEKETSKKIVNELKDVGAAVKDLIQTEKTKFDAGKYDDALSKIGGAFKSMKEKAQNFDEKYLDQISSLDRKRQELEERLQQADSNTSETSEQRELRIDLEKLAEDTKRLMDEMKSQQEN